MLRRRHALVAASVLAAALLPTLAGVAVLRHQAPREPLEFFLPEARPGPDTDVVVVMGCTVRADQLTPYGAPTHVTPWLEGMAHQGTRFKTTIAQAPWTKPSVTALLTSQHGLVAGVTEPSPRANRRILQQGWTTLAERMAASGRTTLGASANPNADAAFGFDQGFDLWTTAAELGTRWPQKVRGADAVDRVLEQASTVEGPLYLQLVLVDTHQPDSSTPLSRLRFQERGLSRRVAGYRAMARELDQSLARLERGLGDLGRDPADILWVFVGDHGEGLFHPWHHGRAHGEMLYPSSVRVPWIMRGPGVARGHVVHGLSAQLDLAPTLGELVGLEPVAEDQGQSWAEQVSGASDHTERTSVFTDTWFRAVSRSAVYTPERYCQLDHFPASTRALDERVEARGRRRPAFVDGCCRWREDPLCEDLEPLDMEEALEDWRRESQRRAIRPENASLEDHEAEMLEELGYVD